ncbi:MAG: 1-acyl-sn-glycerol-3-phosphate acyltransferase [Candidatus Cloacimonetes bacterium]|nr:1-acyl-sn-glycerol-3-phosphate acyltransferase [Candidatus Cloacimonadota bacterium]
MISFFFSLLHRILPVLLSRPVIKTGNPHQHDTTAVYIANHEGSWGPIAMICFFPKKLYPWVLYKLTEKKLCRKHIEEDFIIRELRLLPPWSVILSWLIERICLPLMRYLQVIPVYRSSRNLIKTITASVKCLSQKKSLLIFPEIDDTGELYGRIRTFNTGFVNLARIYYRQTGNEIQFIPVAVNKKDGFIRCGEPVNYRSDTKFLVEKHRIVSHLRKEMLNLYHN